MICHFDGLPAEIWGTVSEWFTFSVTSITGILLFLTLREQVITTKIQQQKFKYDIRPKFTIWESSGKVTTWAGISECYIDYIIILNDNIAFNIDVFGTSDELPEFIKKRKLTNFAPEQKFDIMSGRFDVALLQDDFKLSITFYDEAGTHYFQNLHGKLQDLRLDPPIEIPINRPNGILSWLFD
jgi:hypothetical protein